MTGTAWRVFFATLLGGVVVELAALLAAYSGDPPQIPARFRVWHFYLVKVAFSICLAGVAVVEGLPSPAAGITFGVLGPAALDTVSRGALRALRHPANPD